ncbi:efflux RND transporter permease subunit [Gorillibacterium sp. sgz5001074]|uniref:efflux RND transporter permease subunit n=1 Tax=Gorillibacterium sp. sgz5001074 TaxID=3446695 RepID=UPI003F67AB08
MRAVIRFSLNNKFALWILTVMVILAGTYSGFRMKAETIPNIEVPIMTVTTVFPGGAPQDVLDKATKPLEQRLKGLDGVSTVSSNSAESFSSIILEYSYSKNMDEAEREAREAVSSVKLGTGIQSPTVSRINLNAFPVLTLSLTDEKRTQAELSELVTAEIAPAFQKVPGVAAVQVSGQMAQEVVIQPNPAKIQALGLTVDTVKGILQGSAVTFPLGVFEMDRAEKVLVLDGNVHTVESLGQLALPLMPSAAGAGAGAGAGTGAGAPAAPSPQAGNAGTPAGPVPGPAAGAVAGAGFGLPTVKLGDVADIKVVNRSESVSRTNGKPAIGINIVKTPDGNTLDVVNEIKKEAGLLQSKYDGLNVVDTLDQGEPIQRSISTMLSKAAFGALFAVVIILLFLRNIRSTVISIVSIPLSLLIAVLLLNELDITLNMMTLGAMTVAIGRVIDDSIVVIENIYRRMTLATERLTGKELILEATREMFVPILSSTIVTVAVFLPLALVTGPIGELFTAFALTIVFALAASLLVAVTVVPMLAHQLMGKGMKGKVHREEEGGRLEGWYRKALSWALNHKLITFLAPIVLLIATMVVLVPAVGVSFLPSEEEKTLTITYSPAPAERKQDVEALALKAEELLMKRSGVEVVQYSVGGSGNPFASGASKSALFMVKYKPDYEGFAKEKEKVLEDLQAMGSTGEFKHQSFGSGGGMGGSKLSLFVYGDDLKTIQPAVARILESMRASPSFTNADSSLSESYDQYKLVADQAKLSRLGLTAAQVGMELMPARDRPVLTTVEKNGKDLNVYLEVPRTTPATRVELEGRTIRAPLGVDVALKDIVTIEEGKSPNTLSRRNNRLYAELSADLTGKDVSQATREARDIVEALKLPPELEVQFGGVTEQINESFRQLGLAIAAAVAIVYFVLVLTFGGALAPFAILFSLPFTVIGGLAALYLTGETISVSAMIGALMLIGIVVTNAIVLIDRVIKKERDGLSTREALLEAAATRLRPILMTAIATVGALLPLALGFESGGAMISKGLGVTVIGGLTSSTLLTLLVVPVVYEFMRRLGRGKIRDA